MKLDRLLGTIFVAIFVSNSLIFSQEMQGCLQNASLFSANNCPPNMSRYGAWHNPCSNHVNWRI